MLFRQVREAFRTVGDLRSTVLAGSGAAVLLGGLAVLFSGTERGYGSRASSVEQHLIPPCRAVPSTWVREGAKLILPGPHER